MMAVANAVLATLCEQRTENVLSRTGSSTLAAFANRCSAKILFGFCDGAEVSGKF